jgi:hypothetical protein
LLASLPFVQGTEELSPGQQWAAGLLDQVLRSMKPRKLNSVVKVALAIEKSDFLRQQYAAALRDNPERAADLVQVAVWIIAVNAQGEGTAMMTMMISALMSAGKKPYGQWPAALLEKTKVHWGLT